MLSCTFSIHMSRPIVLDSSRYSMLNYAPYKLRTSFNLRVKIFWNYNILKTISVIQLLLAHIHWQSACMYIKTFYKKKHYCFSFALLILRNSFYTIWKVCIVCMIFFTFFNIDNLRFRKIFIYNFAYMCTDWSVCLPRPVVVDASFYPPL